MKKAALNISLGELIGLILGTGIILVLLFFVVGIIDVVKEKPEQEMLVNFEALTISINELMTKQSGESLSARPDVKITPAQGNAVQIIIPLYIEENYGIIGFDKEEIGQTCGIFNDNIKRPKACIELPCICLGKLGWKSIDESTLCKTIKDVKQIYVAKKEGETDFNFNYGAARKLTKTEDIADLIMSWFENPVMYDLVLWSECSPDPDFNVKDIKIIKLPSQTENGKFDLLFDVLPS